VVGKKEKQTIKQLIKQILKQIVHIVEID